MNIVQNNKKLLYTNRICCFSNNTITFKYSFDEQNQLTVEINFNYNEEKESRIDIRSKSHDKIIIDTHNFNNPLGTGLKEPIKIAKYLDKDIFIVFFIFKMRECNPILDFTLYMEN